MREKCLGSGQHSREAISHDCILENFILVAQKSSGMRGRARDEETGPLINVHFQRVSDVHWRLFFPHDLHWLTSTWFSSKLTEKMDEIRTLLSTLSSDLERLEKLHFSILASPHHDPSNAFPLNSDSIQFKKMFTSRFHDLVTVKYFYHMVLFLWLVYKRVISIFLWK